MRLPLRKRTADIEHLVLLVGIAAWICWFLYDSIRVSPTAENLILIAPTAGLALAVFLLLVGRSLRGQLPQADSEAAAAPTEWSLEGRTLFFIILFAMYIAGLAFVAFDISTFAFVGLSLLLLGERNWLLAIVYSAAFAYLVTYALQQMVSFPFPTLLM